MSSIFNFFYNEIVHHFEAPVWFGSNYFIMVRFSSNELKNSLVRFHTVMGLNWTLPISSEWGVYQIEILAGKFSDVLYDVSTSDTNIMSSKMFQHWASRKQKKQGKYEGQKSKRHSWFVNPIRCNSPTYGATKTGRKSTSVVLILSSQQTPRLQL